MQNSAFRMQHTKFKIQIALFAFCILHVALIGAFTAAQPQAPAAAASRPSAEQQLATVRQYCAGCHNDRVKTAGVSFDSLSADNIGEHAEVIEKAVRKMRGRVMPPPGARQPDAAALDSLVGWLEQ